MSHFNDKAAEWDNEGKIKMMAVLAKKTLERLSLARKLDIMDFGCGTGLFGLEMADYANTLLGIDTSSGMLEVFDKKTQDDSSVESLLIDLEKDSLDRKFDLIVSSMAFHHLNDPDKMIATLKSLLNPDGKIAIVDLDEEDGSFHPDNEGMGVKHYGFSKDRLSSWAEKHKLELDHSLINSIEKNDREYHQFLAIFSK
ncbi:MAG: class I SAM-dependent methyltransferase [Deltaproteobacteria bacterium]|nr:MAG: class I SAM-dependent methyltransferase [Deltaproteobacteria bacterium]